MPGVPVSVMIVDDHAQFRSRLRVLLERAGYDVVGEAQDAAGALVECRRLAPDVVLLDVQLPDHDGFWVAEEIARSPGGPQIVLTSTREADEFGSQLQQTPAAGFIHKLDLSAASLEALVGGPG